MIPAIKVRRDGREVCNQRTKAGRLEYKFRILAMLKRQNGLCCLCNRPVGDSEATFEHQDGRGMNGGHRDDRIEIAGKPYNGAAHGWCNAQKGSRKIDYHSAAALKG